MAIHNLHRLAEYSALKPPLSLSLVCASAAANDPNDDQVILAESRWIKHGGGVAAHEGGGRQPGYAAGASQCRVDMSPTSIDIVA